MNVLHPLKFSHLGEGSDELPKETERQNQRLQNLQSALIPDSIKTEIAITYGSDPALA